MAIIPFDQREGVIWLDGKFVDWKEAKIHVLTHGLHYASTVFEGIRAYNGKIFKLKEHIERLFASAEILEMKIPYSREEIDEACRETLKRQNYQEAYIRPLVFRGSETISVSAQMSKIHVAIAVWQWPAYFDKGLIEKGLRLTFAKWRRPDPLTAPSKAKAAGLYMICTLSKHEAERQGFADALMLDWRGQIAESTGSNIFFVKDGALHTPTPDCFLDGITRRTIMELAKRKDIPIFERAIFPEEMSGFEQCFLVGTAIEIVPVKEIGPYHFKIGNLIRDLQADYHKEVRL